MHVLAVLTPTLFSKLFRGKRGKMNKASQFLVSSVQQGIHLFTWSSLKTILWNFLPSLFQYAYSKLLFCWQQGAFCFPLFFVECQCTFPYSGAELYGASASTTPGHLPAGGFGHQCTFQSHHHRAGQIQQQHSHKIAVNTVMSNGGQTETVYTQHYAFHKYMDGWLDRWLEGGMDG